MTATYPRSLMHASSDVLLLVEKLEAFATNKVHDWPIASYTVQKHFAVLVGDTEDRIERIHWRLGHHGASGSMPSAASSARAHADIASTSAGQGQPPAIATILSALDTASAFHAAEAFRSWSSASQSKGLVSTIRSRSQATPLSSARIASVSIGRLIR